MARFSRGDSGGRATCRQRRADCGAGRAADAGGDGIWLHRAVRAVDAAVCALQGVPVRRVKRFTEKPDRARAEEFVASGNYAWNGGIFLWSARTLANAIREHCPEMAPAAGEDRCGACRPSNPNWTPRWSLSAIFAEVYPLCQNISVDYAVLEPRSAKGEMRSEIYCLPADFGWNDLGSWAALDEHRAGGKPEQAAGVNVCDGASGAAALRSMPRETMCTPRARPSRWSASATWWWWRPTDALLITTRERSQDVGKVVAELKARGREDLI